MSNDQNESENLSDPISCYSRANSIADGVLIELDPQTVKESGIRFPVAMTAAAYAHCVAMNPKAERALNDVSGRLWDVLWMLRNACRNAAGETLFFTVYAVTPDSRGIKPRTVRLKCACGPNDDLTPCLTVMFPEED